MGHWDTLTITILFYLQAHEVSAYTANQQQLCSPTFEADMKCSCFIGCQSCRRISRTYNMSKSVKLCRVSLQYLFILHFSDLPLFSKKSLARSIQSARRACMGYVHAVCVALKKASGIDRAQMQLRFSFSNHPNCISSHQLHLHKHQNTWHVESA